MFQRQVEDGVREVGIGAVARLHEFATAVFGQHARTNHEIKEALVDLRKVHVAEHHFPSPRERRKLLGREDFALRSQLTKAVADALDVTPDQLELRFRENGQLALPFGSGLTSPVATTDVAAVVATVLRAPQDHIGAVYELTGPAALDIDGLAEQYAKALDRPITAVQLPYDKWLEHLSQAGLEPHTQQHIETMAKLHRDDRYNRLTHDVEDLTGRPAQSVQEYISQRRELFT